MNWETRESMRTGKPIPQILAELVEQSGGKWVLIGELSGMTFQSAIAMFRRNGISKPSVWEFEFRGVSASMRQHCKNHGLEYFSVKTYAKRHKLSKTEAMERYLAGYVRKYYWGVPQP